MFWKTDSKATFNSPSALIKVEDCKGHPDQSQHLSCNGLPTAMPCARSIFASAIMDFGNSNFSGTVHGITTKKGGKFENKQTVCVFLYTYINKCCIFLYVAIYKQCKQTIVAI